MDAGTSSTSTRSTAGHRLYRKQNLQSARIHFKKNEPAPPEVLELQAMLFNTEGISLPLNIRYQSASLESIAQGLQPGPEKARYEACLQSAQEIKSSLDRHDSDAAEEMWMKVNDQVVQILMDGDDFEEMLVLSSMCIRIRTATDPNPVTNILSPRVSWDVDIRPQGKPTTPLGIARPDRGFGFAPSADEQDPLSWETLDALRSDPKTRLIFSPQRVPELIFPFCVYEAKSAIEGTLMFAENQAAVGAATAAAIFSELAELSKAAGPLDTAGSSALVPSSVPPVLMLASMGSNWTMHACFTQDIGGCDAYHIYPIMPSIDLMNKIDLFTFQVVLSRIRDYALSVVKPWLREQLAQLVFHENVRETVDERLAVTDIGIQTRSRRSTADEALES